MHRLVSSQLIGSNFCFQHYPFERMAEAMQEVGIDISHKKTQAIFDVFKSGKLFSYVITVCDETSAEKCPIFAGVTRRLHWSFPDPSTLVGAREHKLVEVRKIRDEIRDRIQAWCEEVCPRPVSATTST